MPRKKHHAGIVRQPLAAALLGAAAAGQGLGWLDIPVIRCLSAQVGTHLHLTAAPVMMHLDFAPESLGKGVLSTEH